jgi:hypothetical protein
VREEDRVRIEEEEMVRERARQILADERQRREREQQSIGKKIWAFLQTPFVIFFLSSVLVGLVSLGYTKYQSKQTANRQRKETISNMSSEVAARLHTLNALIEAELVRMTPKNVDTDMPRAIHDVLNISPEQLNSSRLSVNVYPGYKGFSVIALADRLKTRTSGQQKTQIGLGKDLLTRLSNRAEEVGNNIFDGMPDDPNGKPYKQWEKRMAQKLRSFLMQARDTLGSTSLPKEWRT